MISIPNLLAIAAVPAALLPPILWLSYFTCSSIQYRRNVMSNTFATLQFTRPHCQDCKLFILCIVALFIYPALILSSFQYHELFILFTRIPNSFLHFPVSVSYAMPICEINNLTALHGIISFCQFTKQAFCLFHFIGFWCKTSQLFICRNFIIIQPAESIFR